MPRVQSILWLLLAGVGAGSPHADGSSPIRFNRDIRPILSENCFTCHGPDEKTRKARLRLDTQEGLFAKGEDYAIVAPGDSQGSELYFRISTTDADDVMPPPEEGKQLTAEQKELIRRWIEGGAEWEGHWAFIAPERPELPRVERTDWTRNEIDYFILEKLEEEGLEPSPEADRRRLIRRVTFDLTGLPPTLEEVDAFLADESSGAYERVVERLLNSPRYGERMTLHWLDLARYADTHGYHLDSGRDMWKWREWVIDAFNRNMPYDQFTVEQLAGDLLPEATLSQKLATGFNRNNMINFEGGAIPEEYLNHYIVDRVSTTATVFMGLTMACAQCHDHKYDPVSKEDFYRLYAYFNAVPERGLDGNRGNATPFIYLPTPEQEGNWKELERKIARAEERLKEALPEIQAAQKQWENGLSGRLATEWRTLEITEYRSKHGASLTRLEDGSVLAGGENPERDVYELGGITAFSNITGIRLEALTDSSLPENGPGRAGNSNFVLTGFEAEAVSREDSGRRESVKFRSATADYSQVSYEISQAIDGNSNTGWAVDGPNRKQNATAWFRPEQPFGFEGGTEVRIRLKFESGFGRHAMGRVRIALTTDSAPAEGELQEIQAILQIAGESRTEAQQRVLEKHYREKVSGVYQELNGELVSLRKTFQDLKGAIPTSMVMEQMEKPRETHVLIRGQYNQRGEKVEPGVPASLGSLREDAPPNRLGLAQWLVEPEHPLMARVTVNRFWGMVMGTGIVKTANDFGSQAEWPTHPELLDWLAREFIGSGWDVKRMMKMLVTSATYRQSAVVRPELAEKDPYNRLYARGPRFRLEAEAIRDNALAMSGLLVGKVGGPSVFPYQPAGLWEELSSRQDSGNWSAQRFVQSEGEDLYRRSMYTFWKRTSPPPSLQAFDAPDREVCVVQRDRTTTPLQALVLLNDPTYVEAARKLAERMMTEGGASRSERIRFAFRLATARPPTEMEEKILLELFEKQWSRFQAKPEAALELLAAGDSERNESLDAMELAAWTSVASMIMNLDETITKS